MMEFRQVVRRGKLNLPTAYIDSFEEELLRVAMFVVPKIRIDVIKEDPDDNRVLECAVEGKADFIVSGDQHLLRLREYAGINIVPASRFQKTSAS